MILWCHERNMYPDRWTLDRVCVLKSRVSKDLERMGTKRQRNKYREKVERKGTKMQRQNWGQKSREIVRGLVCPNKEKKYRVSLSQKELKSKEVYL